MREFYADYYRGNTRAVFTFEAKDAKEALDLARAKYRKGHLDKSFKPWDDSCPPLEQILILDRWTQEEFLWQSEEYRLREASSDLLKALEQLTDFVERYAYSVDVSGYLEAAHAAIGKARPPNP